MLRSRTSILVDIVQVNGDLNNLKIELNSYTWDSKEPLVIISKEDFIRVVTKTMTGEVTFQDLEHWANILEGRDDIGYETEFMQELIFELANPGINGAISKASLEAMINELRTI